MVFNNKPPRAIQQGKHSADVGFVGLEEFRHDRGVRMVSAFPAVRNLSNLLIYG